MKGDKDLQICIWSDIGSDGVKRKKKLYTCMK